MRTEQFEEVINNRIETCKSVLCSKAEEYATDDRLHNFKVAGKLQKCTAVKALGGMMAKHTVSVYDLIDDYEQGKAISKEMWTEKIGDSINYLLLLTALLEEDKNVDKKIKNFEPMKRGMTYNRGYYKCYTKRRNDCRTRYGIGYCTKNIKKTNSQKNRIRRQSTHLS